MELPPSYQDVKNAITITPEKFPLPPIYQPVIVKSANEVAFGHDPRLVACPKCGVADVTEVSRESGACTWLTSAMLCFVGCPLACFLAPFCLDCLSDTYHFCPNCQEMLGAYSRI